MNDYPRNITCALIAVARNEDDFLNEWFNHNLNLGFDHIYLADNNDKSQALNIVNPKITVIPKNEIDFSIKYAEKQKSIYDEILSEINGLYDFCAICDIDEFFDFGRYKTVQEFIEFEIIYKNNTVAEIPWKVYDDNDLIHSIKGKDVQELYPRPQNKMPFSWCNNECSWGKSIFKLCPGIKVYSAHWPLPESMEEIGFRTIHIKSNVANVKHYRTKSLEDFIKNKASKQNIRNTLFTGYGDILKTYFSINRINSEKLLWACRFIKDSNWTLTKKDREWLLEQFNDFPLVTVVIVSNNYLNKIKVLYQNIINQSNYTCNILIIDDLSSDGTIDWAASKNISILSLKERLKREELLLRGKNLILTPFYMVIRDEDLLLERGLDLEKIYNHVIDNPYSTEIHI